MRNFLFTALLAASSTALVDLHQASIVPEGWRATTAQTMGDAVFHNVMVGLKRSNTALLSQLVAEVSEPFGPHYLNYPSYEALGDLVRPAPEHTAAVKAWVAEHGVTILNEHPHGDYLTLRATVTQLEAMSNGAFTTYEHTTGALVQRMTDVVRVPDAVAAAVETFSGFTGFPLEPKEVTKSKPSSKCLVTPPVVRSTYGITNVPSSGKRNIQAIAEFQTESVSDKDLTKFCKDFDPTTKNCTINRYIGVNNQSRPSFESTLDVDYIVPVSRNAETWVYSVLGKDFCSDLLYFGSNVTSLSTYPHVISVSYGSQMINFCKQELSDRFAADVEKMTALGITVMIASGDFGSGHWAGGTNPDNKMSPSFPASVPHAVAVGSTTWIKGTTGEEQASTSFGSGGGFSYNFTAPSYQTAAIATYLKTVPLPKFYTFAKGGRGSPDVSMLGQNFTIGGGEHGNFCLSGTSASSPSFAAVMTLLNEVCLAESGKPLGFVNPLFYQNADMFNDITVGDNAKGDNFAGWNAGKGWDACTGLGTPNFPKMVAVVKKACASARKQ